MTASDSILPPISAEELESGEVERGAAVAELLHESQSHRKLEGTAVTATIWTIGSYGVSQSMRLASNLFLTHLLAPEFFGLMGLISTLVTGMRLLTDIGLIPSVIGSPRGDEPIFLDTAFTVQIVRGLALWGAALVLTWPLAHLYGNHALLSLLPVLSFTIVLDGFQSTNLITAARHIGVRRLVTIDFINQIFTTTVTLVWAYFSRDVWALVAGTMASSIFKTTVSHIPRILPGRRNSLAWEKEAVHSLVHFGKWILLGTAFYFLAGSADRLILGKLIPLSLLGVYIIAFTVADIPRQVILQFTDRVGLPFIAKMSHLPRPEFRANCIKYRFYVLVAGALVLTAVVNCGGFFVRHAYNQRYHGAVWMVPILALGLWHTLLYSTSKEILVAVGKTHYNAIGTALFAVAMFVFLPLGYHYFGMTGAVVSVAAGDLPLYIVLGIGVAREKVSLWRQDALATLLFLACLALGYGLKRLVG
jgi:O-antigen/teichoic acid export membrane protein